jgi:hypothetical protein
LTPSQKLFCLETRSGYTQQKKERREVEVDRIYMRRRKRFTCLLIAEETLLTCEVAGHNPAGYSTAMRRVSITASQNGNPDEYDDILNWHESLR